MERWQNAGWRGKKPVRVLNGGNRNWTVQTGYKRREKTDGNPLVQHQDESMSQPLSAHLRLVRQARCGDRKAQQELWCAHRRWIAAIVLAYRPQSVDADDLIQEVAVKMVSKIEFLREETLFRPWLRQIVINVCRGTARALKPTLYLASSDAQGDSGQEIGRVAVPATDAPSVGRHADRHDDGSRSSRTRAWE